MNVPSSTHANGNDDDNHNDKNKKKKIRLIKDEDGELIRVGDDGCEVRSDDEDDDGADLKDFIVNEDPDENDTDTTEKSRLVDLDQKNIITGKRKRNPVQRYIDTEDFQNQCRELAMHDEEEIETETEDLDENEEDDEECNEDDESSDDDYDEDECNEENDDNSSEDSDECNEDQEEEDEDYTPVKKKKKTVSHE
jgi:topoisomerase-4 subunit A